MAYTPNKWNDYDNSKSFSDNVKRDAVVTSAKLRHIEDGIVAANDINIGTVSTGETPDVNIRENNNKKYFDFVFPNSKGGLSAYDLAVLNGYTGTYEEWAESLKGEPGYTPVKGIDYFTDEDIKGMAYNVLNLKKTTPYVDHKKNAFFACGTAVTIDGNCKCECETIKATWYEDGKKVTISFNNTYNIFGGGDGTEYPVYYESTSIILNDGVVNSICGGNLGNGAVGVATVIMNGGHFNGYNGIGGGGLANYEGKTYKNSVGYANVIVNDSDEKYPIGVVYGGCIGGFGSVGTAKITINGGNISFLTAGGSNGNTSDAEILIDGGTISTVQGCNKGHVNNIKITVKGGDITKLYAGRSVSGDFTNATYNKSELNILGGSIYHICAGINNGKEDCKGISGVYVKGVINNEDRAELIGLKLVSTLNDVLLKCVDTLVVENGVLVAKNSKGDPIASVKLPTTGSGTGSGEKGDKGDKGDPGEKGEKGEKGEPGKDGKDGYTPVKGVDYFTEEDIKQLATDVILANKTTPYVDDELNAFFACGTHVIITEGSVEGKTKAMWYTESDTIQSIEFDSNYNVFGGGDGYEYPVNYAATCITLSGGSVNSITGGCFGAGYVGKVTIMINSGSVFGKGGICGGGGGTSFKNQKDCVNTVGETEIIINEFPSSKPMMLSCVYGGGPTKMSAVGHSKIKILNGNVNFLTAGGADGQVLVSDVVIEGGKVNVLQGVNDGNVNLINMTISGGMIKRMYAGVELESFDNNGTYGKCVLNLTGGDIEHIEPGRNGKVESSDCVSGTYMEGVVSDEEIIKSFNLVKTTTLTHVATKIVTSMEVDESGVLKLKNSDNEIVAETEMMLKWRPIEE